MLTRSSRCGNILNGIFGANKKLGGKKLDVAGVLSRQKFWTFFCITSGKRL